MLWSMSDKLPIEKIVQGFEREGLRFLFLFKTIKEQIQNELKKEGKSLPNEAILNKICAETAKELLIDSEQTPTKEEISKVLQCLKEKLNIHE